MKRTLSLFLFLTLYAMRSTLSAQDWNFGGEITSNYRNIGAKPAEVEIEHQLYASDVYFYLNKKLSPSIPFNIEFTTDLESKPILNQFHLDVIQEDYFKFTVGKFIVPFGRYNEIYKPSEFLSITRPLPYASPKSLDYVARLNYGHPITASGFSSLGVEASWLSPKTSKHFIPSRFDFYIVNGWGENPLLGRGFPRAEVLGVPSQQGGVLIDYGHERSTLADNNDTKMVGARTRFALGDLRVPFVLPEGKRLQGAQLGVSWAQGKYDAEDFLDHLMWGVEFTFQLGRYQIMSEYIYSPQDYRIPLSTQTTDLASSPFPQHREYLRGFYVSNAFRLPHWFYGEETFAYIGYSFLSRQGESLGFDQTKNIAFLAKGSPWIKKTMEKTTIGFRSKINEHFVVKLEFSYWDLNQPDTRVADGANIYQGAFSGVISF